MKHYTLTQCMQLLAVNNRQLKRLLESTSIIPVTASSDRRMLVITDIQLTTLKEKLALEDRAIQPATPEDTHTLWHEIELLKQRISELERKATLSSYTRARTAHSIGQVDIEVQEGTPRQEAGKEGVSLLPDGYMNLNEFAALHHIPATTLKKAIDSGRLACHHNPSGWKHFRTYVKWALDPEQQAAALALYQQS